MWRIDLMSVDTSYYMLEYSLAKCTGAPGYSRTIAARHPISGHKRLYKRIHGKLRAYLIDFDLASLSGHVSHNLARNGMMALELPNSAGPERTAVMDAYEHDAEAICWILFWMGMQYEGGNRVGHAFESWEMVDVVTCYEKKRSFLDHPDLEPFTGPNQLLQGPVRGILQKFAMHCPTRLLGGDLPPYHEWLKESDKEIRSS